MAIDKDTLQYISKSIRYHFGSMLEVQKVWEFVEIHFNTTTEVSKFLIRVAVSRISLQDSLFDSFAYF